MDLNMPYSGHQQTTTEHVKHVQTFEPQLETRDSIGVNSHMTQHEMSHNTINSSQSSAIFSSLVPCNMFFSGYLDCAHEALRYLLEVERLSLDHPMVVGLQCQLYEQYRLLQLQYILANNLQVTSVDQSSPSQVNVTAPAGSMYQRFNNPETNNVSILSNVKDHHSTSTNGLGSLKHSTQMDLHDNANITNASQVDSRNVSNSDPIVGSSSVPFLGPTEEAVLQNSGLPEDAQRVASALAEEIYSLLNSEQEFSDDEDDDDEFIEDGSIDEGFEEMTEPV